MTSLKPYLKWYLISSSSSTYRIFYGWKTFFYLIQKEQARIGILSGWIAHILSVTMVSMGFPHGLSGKEFACQCRRCGFNPWFGKIACRSIWQPTSVFLPGESHDQRSLVDYSLWGHKESDPTERLNNNNNGLIIH